MEKHQLTEAGPVQGRENRTAKNKGLSHSIEFIPDVSSERVCRLISRSLVIHSPMRDIIIGEVTSGGGLDR